MNRQRDAEGENADEAGVEARRGALVGSGTKGRVAEQASVLMVLSNTSPFPNLDKN